MKVVSTSIVVEDELKGIEILKKLEKAGRTCYKSENKITEDSALSFIKFIIARGHETILEHEKITVRVICDRGCCYSEDTKILTENGWKLFKDLEQDEKVASMTDEGELVFLLPKKIIVEPYKGDMVQIKTTQINLLVTPNHNTWVKDYGKRSVKTRIWKFIRADELNNKRYMFAKSIENFKGKDLEYIDIPSVEIHRGFYDKTYEGRSFETNAFMKFLGIWITDGCLCEREKGSGINSNRIVITQVKEKGCNYIENVLSELKMIYRKSGNDYCIPNPALFHFLYNNFIKNNDFKKTYYINIPKWIKSLKKENLLNLLEGIIVGNGTKHTGGEGYQIYMGSQNLAEDIVEIAIKCGKTANLYIKDERIGENHNGFISKIPEIYVSIVKTNNTLFNKNENTYSKIKYEGNVYCVELPYYHKLMVMRNGKPCWCGNSHEIVRHRIASYSQESTRYVNYSKDKFNKELTVIEPCFWLDGKGGREYESIEYQKYCTWVEAMLSAEKAYMELLRLGATPQEARSVLPNSLKTEIVMTMNLREWRHFFKLRTAKVAHPQMIEAANLILKAVKSYIPIIFDDI